MRSIPTIFIWSVKDGHIIDKPSRECNWVFEGKGIATRKFDGLAIKVERGKAFYRFEWRVGKPVPNGFEACQASNPKKPNAPIPGWVPVDMDFLENPKGRQEKALQAGWNATLAEYQAWKDSQESKKNTIVNPYAPEAKKEKAVMPDGTYELCGPDIRGNHEKVNNHIMMPHGSVIEEHVPRTFAKLQKFMAAYPNEGIVWHYKCEGQTLMAKIKKSDFSNLQVPVPVVVPDKPLDPVQQLEKLAAEEELFSSTCAS